MTEPRVSNHRSRTWLAALVALCALANHAQGETIARCGAGWLERIDGTLVLHLKGNPYEMGYQHGALLKDHIQENLNYLVNVKGATKLRIGPLDVYPRAAIETIVKFQKPYTPERFEQEMDGLAAATGIAPRDVRMANFIPELFHCSGFAVMGSATAGGTLYHGRILDYAIDWQLQRHAVLFVAEPAGRTPLVNVSYAGFIGSVTGMNVRGISIGEMGGGGFGHWRGVPMALLVREALETAGSLEQAVATFRDRPRTCKYYYVIADGTTNRAAGLDASWDTFTAVSPGQLHPLLPTPVKDALLLSAGNRYRELVRRTQEAHGSIDAEGARRLMDRPVAMESNLHNVLFAPRSTDFWVANASVDRKPAATQKYHAFNLRALLARKPQGGAREIPLVGAEAHAGAVQGK